MISEHHRKILLKMQVKELTEAVVYTKLAKKTRVPHQREILLKIAQDEANHAEILVSLTNKKARPNRFKAGFFLLLTKIFGLTFGLRLMEKGEGVAQSEYQEVLNEFEVIKTIYHDEEEHESALIDLLNEKKLKYVGSIVLGLNDALVELTGALAGLTIAINQMETIVLSGLVTGIAASFSMAASEYLSSKTEGAPHPFRSAVYTGLTYLGTVGLLVLPYLFGLNSPDPSRTKWISLGIMIGIVVVIVAFFNFYVAVVKKTSFIKRFLEMLIISLGVAGFSFLVGLILKTTLGI